ncbi:hypothetical protein MNBD_CHLOROFLEXI01-5043 [hydrothermal vent metagenome]|uniref:alanine--tRNA ligase n=1 Tax=hydrothermal vent metagenome TaxID=652676 RepID=A0A3B0VEB3_9ZZZZ
MHSIKISQLFTSYFAKLEHTHLPAASLLHPSIPMSFVMSAGLVQIETALKNELVESGKSYVLTQTCFRHFDLDKIGDSPTHLSLFHMPGAFDFGTHNKPQTIYRLWHLLTNIYSLDKNTLKITYFNGEDSPFDAIKIDEEAKSVWLSLGLDPTQVVGRCASHNLWQQGGGIKNSVRYRKCGVSTEVFFDRGTKYSCGINCLPGCSCSRYIELANMLFVSHKLDEGIGQYSSLSLPFSETVIGSERIAMVLQNQTSIFKINSIAPMTDIVDSYCASKQLDNLKAKSIIVDHIRALAYLVADGAPSPHKNGRQRIVRKLIRSILTQCIILQIPVSNCIHDLLQNIKMRIQSAEYTAWLKTTEQYFEEESIKFYKTISRGKTKLNSFLNANDGSVLTGHQVLFLEKTIGLPLELTKHFLIQLSIPYPQQQYLVEYSKWIDEQNKY